MNIKALILNAKSEAKVIISNEYNFKKKERNYCTKILNLPLRLGGPNLLLLLLNNCVLNKFYIQTKADLLFKIIICICIIFINVSYIKMKLKYCPYMTAQYMYNLCYIKNDFSSSLNQKVVS